MKLKIRWNPARHKFRHLFCKLYFFVTLTPWNRFHKVFTSNKFTIIASDEYSHTQEYLYTQALTNTHNYLCQKNMFLLTTRGHECSTEWTNKPSIGLLTGTEVKCLVLLRTQEEGRRSTLMMRGQTGHCVTNTATDLHQFTLYIWPISSEKRPSFT